VYRAEYRKPTPVARAFAKNTVDGALDSKPAGHRGKWTGRRFETVVIRHWIAV